MNKLISNLKKNKEKGNSLPFIIILFPLIMACFGLAIDIAVQAMTITTLQSSADAATQSVIANSRNAFANNRPGLAGNEAKANFVKYYDSNRKSGYSNAGTNNNPFLRCQGSSGDGLPIRSGCGFKITSFNYDANGRADTVDSNIRVTIHEESTTLFLKVIGIDHIDYTITSTARLTSSAITR